jgi:O-acetyl-ADP-ribose deacetylase (regulator of RNase III)
MNWEKVIPTLQSDLKLFVNRELSAENLYKSAIIKGVGPELRDLVRSGANRARKVTREALRRRNLLA